MYDLVWHKKLVIVSSFFSQSVIQARKKHIKVGGDPINGIKGADNGNPDPVIQ